MATIFGEPGGEPFFGLSFAAAETAGIWSTDQGGTFVNTGQPGRQAASDGKIYAIRIPNATDFFEKTFAPNYAHMITGWAVYIPAPNFTANHVFFTYKDGTATQVDARTDANGHVFLTRNGTQIGSTSTAALSAGWNYLELETTFATGATGSATFRANGVTLVTVSTVQTASTANAFANRIRFTQLMGINGNNHDHKDIYVLDASTGANTAFLGDSTVWTLFKTGAGANAQFADSVGPFTLTSVNTTGVYQGTITGGAANAYVGKKFTVTGFVNGANNQVQAVCTASTATALTLGGTTVTETHAGSAAFLAGGAGMVSDGLTHTGTWPDGDTTYVFDSTPGHISDFASEALALTGTIYAKLHLSYVRKDDAGARSFRQVTVSGGTTHTNGADIALTNTYLYYLDAMDVDPNTGSAWTLANLNASTDGVKAV